MCRAVYALIVAPDDEAAAALRRAVGLEVQVMGIVASVAGVPPGPFDVVVLDARAEGAAGSIPAWREAAPGAAILWVGDDPPTAVEHAVPWSVDLSEVLPGAVTKALLARRR